MSEIDAERAALLASARAYLEWEREMSDFGVPAFAPEAAPVRREAERAPPPEAERAAQSSAATAARVPVTGAAGSPAPAAAPAGVEALASTQPEPRPSGGDAPDRRLRLQQLDEEVSGCTRCELAKGRTRTVFARGNPDSPLVFIGEGPGQEEDRAGLPFVGPAGQLLDRMVAAMGFARDDVYICNVVKCRPPGNRTPLPSEASACAPFLRGQLSAVQPRVIVALGRCAAENLGLAGPGGGWRGRWGTFHGVDVMPTYHPAFLLRSPEFKRPVWEDLQQVMTKLKQSG